MSRAESLGSVAWRSVIVERDAYHCTCLADSKLTLRAALDLARKASLTYPESRVCVFKGKRVGKLTAIYRQGSSTDARLMEASR